MKYLEEFMNRIICADCLEVMKTMPDNCIDTIITDPPYGLSFMGKDWDNFKNSRIAKSQVVKNLGTGMRQTTLQENINFMEWTSMWAKEALRILKPGGTMLCFAGSRTQHLVAFGIELAGWILKDCIMWLYGQGFPKATDISKQIDKRKIYRSPEKFGYLCKEKREELGISVGKADKIINNGTGNYRIWIEGTHHKSGKPQRLPRWKEYLKIKELYNLDDSWDEAMMEAEREIIGKNNYTIPKEVYQIGKDKEGMRENSLITAPATPKAILWNGWKSHGLKPAYEPILVAMKPNEGNYANNALKYGVAGLNIDEGRIVAKQDYFDTERFNDRKTLGGYGSESIHKPFKPAKGRYPANVILDEEAGKILDEQSGVNCGAFAPVKRKKRPNNVYGEYETFGDDGKTFRGDIGGASRFFYCAKASKAERNRGCKGLEEKPAHDYGSIKKSEGRHGKNMPNSNYHPTVKPLSLMKYLCTLTKTPTGGIVFDPFCGSGTTLIACKELKRSYIGIDNIPEYCEIARRRVNAIPESLF